MSTLGALLQAGDPCGLASGLVVGLSPRSSNFSRSQFVAGIPKTIQIASQEIREAIAEPVNTIVEAVRIALEKTPPELAADIVDKGIVLAGGGALIKNLDILLKEETGLPIMIAEDPLSSVVIGSGKALDQIDILTSVTMS